MSDVKTEQMLAWVQTWKKAAGALALAAGEEPTTEERARFYEMLDWVCRRAQPSLTSGLVDYQAVLRKHAGAK